jgi:hypothetical protein
MKSPDEISALPPDPSEHDLSAQLIVYLEHINDNLRRTGWLISVADAIKTNPSILGNSVGVIPATGDEHEDLLRAAVILTHAYLEDFLRMLGRTLLPLASKEVLDEIPLTGTGRQAQKFFLGSLMRHLDKAVEQVVQESADEYLDNYTFNNGTQVMQFLAKLGIKVDSDLTTLNQMIQRRHSIAHRGDKVRSKISEKYEMQPISALDVIDWVKATNDFVNSVVRLVIEQKTPPESYLRNYFKRDL